MRFRGRHFEPLERRRLMAAVYPTVYEQYMVELYNWARANPSAAATKYGVDLNEGPPGVAISTDAKQPLAINPLLDGASHAFAQWMMDHDQFGHYVDGSDPQSRMAASGYSFTGSYGAAENIELISSSWGLDPLSTVQSEFQNYYTDGSIDGRWHRVNMMDPTMKEVGSGVVTGDYSGMNAMISVEDFAHSGTTSFLTGVAYTDTSGDNFYTPGEQMGGVTVTAIRASDGATFSTTTWDSGGYSLALPAGTYTVWGGGGTLGGYVKYNSVVIGSTNVKRDFRPDDVNSNTGPVSPPPASPPPASPPPASPPPASPPPASPPPASPPPASPPPVSPPPVADFAQLSNGTLSISGTTRADHFDLSESVGILIITRNSESMSYHVSDVHSIVLSAGNGNDTVTFESGVAIRATIIGGNGDDVLHGGDAADVLRGGAGNDKLYGGNGDDSLYGDDGNDSLFGQNGNDLLDGRAGADYMSGGKNIDTVDYSSRTSPVYVELTGAPKSGEAGEKDSVLPDVENIEGGSGNDRLIGSSAANSIWGNGGNDSITGNGGADWLWGGNGNDHFYIKDSIKDHINGGNGIDSVSGDLMDSLTSVEFH